MFYAMFMTLSLRNNCFKAGLIISTFSLFIILTTFSTIRPYYPEVSGEGIRLFSGIIERIFGSLLDSEPYVPLAATAGAVIYSLIGIILIYYFYEKTQSPEILFIGLFIVSFAFECIKIMIPLSKAMALSNSQLIMGSRILIFGRYFGIFSLFTSSVFAAGLKVQKQENFLLVTIAAALIFALGIPIDGLTWDSTLFIQNDFYNSLSMVETGIIIISIASFFIAAYTRGSKQYIPIGLGAILIYLGRNILLNGDTWPSPFIGLFTLCFGTWLSCLKLHRIYLWL